jgi:hypothetical protein
VVVPDDDVVHRLTTGSMLFLVNSNEGCSLLNPLSRPPGRRRPLGSSTSSAPALRGASYSTPTASGRWWYCPIMSPPYEQETESTLQT